MPWIWPATSPRPIVSNLDFVATNQLQVQMSGLGTLSPNYSNAWLEIGRNYSITSAPASGFAFTNWVISTNWIGGTTISTTNLQFMMASNLTLQANFVDTNKPTVSITNLAAGQRVSNAVFTVKGTAGDNWQVSNVVCQINGGGWNSATNINNWTNWAAGVTLMPGTNVVQAYASDTSGNVSTTNSVSFQFVVTNQLQIHASGLGTISPNDSNTWLEMAELQHHLQPRERLCLHQLGGFDQLARRHRHNQNEPDLHDGLKPDLAGQFSGCDQADPDHYRTHGRPAHGQRPGNSRGHGRR